MKSTINHAYNITVSLSTMDMLPNLRTQFNKNKEIITGIKNQIFRTTASTSKKLGRSAGEFVGNIGTGNKTGGCYITTMA